MLPQVLRAGSMTARSFLPAAWPVAVTYGNSVNNLGLISNGLLAQKGPMQAANQPWRSGYAGAFATNSTSAGNADPAAQMGVDNPAGTVFGAGYVAAHPGMKSAPAGLDVKQANAPESVDADVQGVMRNPVYPKEYVLSVHPKHVAPQKLHQKMALFSITVVRSVFDLATGYNHDKMNETKWLRRMIFLETIAGVPGMVGGMLRHLKSLRRMQRDNGWINTLLEEAENERMHLLTFLEIRKPGPMFRAMVILAQGVMFNMLFMAYLISPKFCHAFVGYLEEEAVKTYTQALKEIDAGKLWPNTPAPAIAKNYWWLGDDATMRDLILAVRADEACHSHVNHTLAELPPDQKNPFLGKDSHLVP